MPEANQKPGLKISQSADLLPRLGVATTPNDPYWVQVREAVYRGVRQSVAELVPLEMVGSLQATTTLDSPALAEEILAQALDALICVDLPPSVVERLLTNQLPVIQLAETEETLHRLFTSPRGLYECARLAGEYIARRLGGRGRTLCVGGLMDIGCDKGKSRIQGYVDALRPFPDITVLHCPTYWDYTRAYPQIETALRTWGPPIDAIFGISDPLALAARDAGRATHIFDPQTIIIGINGDPEALVAIAEGSLTGTVDTSATALGYQAVELAATAALGQPLPHHYSYQSRLLTAENVAEASVEKLATMVSVLDSLVGVNRLQEQWRLAQLETSMAINRRVGAILDRRQLSQALADLIRINYGYDQGQFFLWEDAEQMLVREDGDGRGSCSRLTLVEAGVLGQVIQQNEPIIISDYHYTHRFSPDPAWPETRGRVILPVRLGDKLFGVLDLHSRQPIQQLQRELMGLQSLADQFGIAMRNAELYAAALQARTQAEKADQLKTRLLANVSHELRTPLNVILGYIQAALEIPNPYHIDLPPSLQHDLNHIYKSGEHLIRLINDLLDLSRAEIGALDLFPETIAPRSFLTDVFCTIADTTALQNTVTWQLCLPERLPVIHADPVRLRQILLNLLHNASKFTSHGEIVLGAEVSPPHLHIWVQDTGTGISIEMQERIFEPFVTGEYPDRQQGIGLGLSITRHLVALHNGSMTLESQPNQGSTFHLYLPLPNLSGQAFVPIPETTQPTLLLISARDQLSETITELTHRRGLAICRVRASDDLTTILTHTQPVALAWDLSEASPDDWALIERLRRHPQLSQLPFVFFGQEAGEAPDQIMGMTNVLVKPVSGKTLLEMLTALGPSKTTVGSVLIVDDDPEARALYQRLVAQALPGYLIRTAENGAVALTQLAQETPSLVILDLIMPEMDGFAVLREMRSNAQTRHVRVLVMSGRILSYEDVQRLDYQGVIFQSKELLASDEAMVCLQKMLIGEEKLPQPTSVLVKRALAYLHQNYAQSFSRQTLAQAVGVSKSYLNELYGQEIGLSPWECLNRFRIIRAKEWLTTTSESITIIAANVGFDDPAYFSRVFRKYVGQSPRTYRQSHI